MSYSASFNPGAAAIAEAPAGDLPDPVQGVAQPRGIEAMVPPAAMRDAEAIRQAKLVEQPDGSFSLMGPEEAAEPQGAADLPHDANLVEYLDATVLARVAAEVLDGIEADEDSCADYFAMIEEGLGLLPLKVETDDDLFEGASGAVHPMMLIALIRFVAFARAEMLPAAGPARCETYATPSEAVEGRAQRAVRWLNYYLTKKDRGYYPDCDAGALWLGIFGSIFRKVYDDPVTGEPRSRYMTPLSLLVSWHAPSLEEATRVTHIDMISTGEAIRRQLSGYYRQDVDFMANSSGDETPLERVRKSAEQRQPSQREEDAEQVHLHCHCWLDLEGLEHRNDKDEPTGLPLPYVVTIDRRSTKVLRVERDWEEGDPYFRRRDTYVHFLMHPGLGFYGWGFVSLMAAQTNTASTMWRQAINAFAMHSFPGGFRTKGMRLEDTDVRVAPGEFPEIDTGGLPIGSAVMALPYRDVPPSFPALFGTVTEAGQALGQTQEMQVGAGRQDAPVGTTLALIEQAMKPTAAVFQRLHSAQAQELQLLAKRFGRDQNARYEYAVDGQKGVALAADFADTADIVPVSDPNVPTQMQRLGQAQATLSLAQASGGMVDMRAAMKAVLLAMGRNAQEIAALMPEPGQGQPADVATEFALVLKGMPLAVGPTQDHLAHIKAHLAAMKTPGLPPPIVAALMAHVGEHVAAWYRLQADLACQQAGIQLPPPGQPMPPALETAMAQAVAAASDVIAERLAAALGGGMSDPLRAEELALKRAELAFKQQDGERKAEQAGRQDQTEALKAQLQHEDNMAERADHEAQREADLAAGKLDLAREVVKAASQAGRQPATRRPVAAP